MRRLFTIALAGAAAAVSTSAFATPTPTPTPSTDPCSYAVVTGAVACVGYYGNNLLTGTTGSATTATEQTYINLLLNGPATTSDPSNYNPPYSIDTDTVLAAIASVSGNVSGSPFTFNFSPLDMSGWTVFGAHFGNFPDSNATDVTAFWLVNVGNGPTSSITISDGKGLSNAQIFGTGTPVGSVPEPATWGLMLLGFAGVGVAMRRSRKNKPALMQVA